MTRSKRQVKPLTNVTASQAPHAASTRTLSASKGRKGRKTDQHPASNTHTEWPLANSPRGTQALCPSISKSSLMRPLARSLASLEVPDF